MPGCEAWDESAVAYRTYCDRNDRYRRLAELLLTDGGLWSPHTEVPGVRTGLDLACGCGEATLLLAKMKQLTRIYAVDYSAGMLQEARRRLADHDHITYVCASAEEIATLLPPESVSLAVCSAAWWHFDDPERVLSGLARVMQPGGRFSLNLPDFRQPAVASPFHRAFYELLKRRNIQRPAFRPAAAPRTDLQALACATGFRYSARTVELQSDIESIHAFYQIPIMSQGLAPHLPASLRMELATAALHELAERGEPIPPVRWFLIHLDREAHT